MSRAKAWIWPKTVGEATTNGSLILAALNPEYVLMLGGGGERIVYHSSAAVLPEKCHLYLHFNLWSRIIYFVRIWEKRYCGSSKRTVPGLIPL